MQIAGRILFAVCTFVFLAGLGVLVLFESWRDERLTALEKASKVLKTRMGKVEILETGEPQGPPVVVLHGAGGGYDQGAVLGGFLAKKGFRVISLSRPGYLRTPLSSGILVEDQGALVISVLDALGIRKAALLALAEGAPAAVHAAIARPDRITSLVLLAPIVLRSPPPPIGEVRLPAEALLEHITGDVSAWWISEKVRRFPFQPLFRTLQISTALIPYECSKLAEKILTDPVQTEWFQQFFQALVPVSPRESGVRNDLVQMRTLPKLALSKLTMPVLVVVGRLDKLVPAANAKALLDEAPAAKALPLRQAGFFTTGMGPQASEVQEAIQRFLRGLPLSPLEPDAPDAGSVRLDETDTLSKP
jgi:pimeloyl-ACP methyl ester carboxylesterase